MVLCDSSKSWIRHIEEKELRGTIDIEAQKLVGPFNTEWFRRWLFLGRTDAHWKPGGKLVGIKRLLGWILAFTAAQLWRMRIGTLHPDDRLTHLGSHREWKHCTKNNSCGGVEKVMPPTTAEEKAQKNTKKCTKKSDFHWTKDAEAAFKQMKQLTTELPMLTAPEYLAAAKEAQTPEKILPSAPNYSGHGPAYKASIVKTRADFIVERPEEDDPDIAMEVKEELSEPWILFTDGSSCAVGSGAGLILTNPEGAEFTYALRFIFEATKNEAEYEALIAGLRIAEEIGVKNLQANMDSRLVANQVNEPT
ncbi:reverse transcriptase domain-containing protein [Tanacetum coccineum]